MNSPEFAAAVEARTQIIPPEPRAPKGATVPVPSTAVETADTIKHHKPADESSETDIFTNLYAATVKKADYLQYLVKA